MGSRLKLKLTVNADNFLSDSAKDPIRKAWYKTFGGK